jgi:hypothetical protein
MDYLLLGDGITIPIFIAIHFLLAACLCGLPYFDLNEALGPCVK